MEPAGAQVRVCVSSALFCFLFLFSCFLGRIMSPGPWSAPRARCVYARVGAVGRSGAAALGWASCLLTRGVAWLVGGRFRAYACGARAEPIGAQVCVKYQLE